MLQNRLRSRSFVPVDHDLLYPAQAPVRVFKAFHEIIEAAFLSVRGEPSHVKKGAPHYFGKSLKMYHSDYNGIGVS
jgi:hypothetical protein